MADDAADPVGLAGDDAGEPRHGVGLCLSGGGYRAMLFHAGALTRMNEAGLLGRLDRVSSVSGGSMAAGALGVAWSRLAWEEGVATNLDRLVTAPLVDLAGHTVDVPSVLLGLWPGRIARGAASRLGRRLFGHATLQSLPKDGDGPRFVITATNLSNGTLWRFSRPYMRDYLTPEIAEPTVPLADAVAASAAFPPVLSPFVLHPRRFAGPGLDPTVPGTVTLTDGGVYDNLGVEPVWKRCATVFVSDGGGPFKVLDKPRRNWLSGTVRTLKVVDVEVRRLRRHQVIDGLERGRRTGAYWGISSSRGDFSAPGLLPWTDAATSVLAGIPTRLGRLPATTRRRVVNWGYAAADAALRTYYEPSIRAPAGFPFPEEGLG
jgi:NTE family protein